MKTYFKYNEEMYHSYYKYYLNIIFKDNTKYSINEYDKFICPYCGHELCLKDEYDNYFNFYYHNFNKRLYLTHKNSVFNAICENPLYKYKLYIIKELYQTCIGTFRTSPIITPIDNIKNNYNKFRIKSFKEYDLSFIPYKYNIDYSKDDTYEDGTELPKVKYRRTKIKYGSGKYRSNGWKSKKVKHQWEINLKR